LITFQADDETACLWPCSITAIPLAPIQKQESG
jgi:hypothetical protein